MCSLAYLKSDSALKNHVLVYRTRNVFLEQDCSVVLTWGGVTDSERNGHGKQVERHCFSKTGFKEE